MDSSDVMFGIIFLGFVLSGMTARAKYLELKLGRRLSEKSGSPAVAPPRLSPGLEDTRATKPQSETGRPRLPLSGSPALHTAHHSRDRPGGPIRRGAKGLAARQ
jgi:hypothetical protein